MAWLVVSKSGDEQLFFHDKPQKIQNRCWGYEDRDFWEIEDYVFLDTGTIEGILGRELSWSDEPIEIVVK